LSLGNGALSSQGSLAGDAVLGFSGIVRKFACWIRPAWTSSPSRGLAGILFMLLSAGAVAFDYDRYKPADLDAISARKPPSGMGVDVFPVQSYRFEVTLAAQATPCATKFLKWAMVNSGIPKEFIEKAPISSCIQVKSAKGKLFSMYIQDVLTEHLAKEASPGEKLMLYAALIYFDQTGPGIVINEFNGPQGKQGDEKEGADCGCGKQFHSGSDYSAPTGTPVPVVEDGIVVKLEDNELATVDTPTAGQCGRYAVVKHSFPNGRAAYSRYAQLGKLVGSNGKPIALGQQVKANDTIGEVGSQGRFHFEVRPVDSTAMDRSPEWTRLYGADPAMDWSRHQPVDPAKFDAAVFGGKSAVATEKK
jgi:murein DD-endopeptidase MepM/ murein hydrolase activator NlpD